MTDRGAAPAGRRRPDQALADRARPDPRQCRRAERPQRRLPVADRERQGVAVAPVPAVDRRRARRPHRLVPHRRRARAAGRPCRANDRSTLTELGRIEHVDGRSSRDVSILEVTAGPSGCRVGAHAHAGDEHHVVLRGRFRMIQGDHVVDARSRRLPPLGRDDPARRRGHRRRRRRDADHPDPPARLTVPAHCSAIGPPHRLHVPGRRSSRLARCHPGSTDRHLPDINVSYIFNAMFSSSPATPADPIDAPRDERPNLTDELLDELSRWGPRERGGMFRSWHRGSLSIVHLIVLTVLEADGPRSMGDLAEALDVSVASATGIVDRMERRGLVERRPDR